jgi:hypothetical protein
LPLGTRDYHPPTNRLLNIFILEREFISRIFFVFLEGLNTLGR